LREALAASGGGEPRNLGSGLFVAVPSAVTALAVAVALQKAAETANRAAVGGMAVRVGVHVGEAIIEEADYFAPAVVTTQRLCRAGDPGQIVASQLVCDLVGSRASFVTRPLGTLELTGIA